ncbi:hypothetical protein Hanom_Chr14g01274961 [Helianthus anomalus]
MPSKFIKWGLEEDIDAGEEVAPKHPKRFKKEREKLPYFYQVVTVEKTDVPDRIIGWKYYDLKGMFREKAGCFNTFEHVSICSRCQHWMLVSWES